MVVTDTRILLGTRDYVYSSTTDGFSWTVNQLPSMTPGNSTKVGNTYYVATFTGVYRSTDEGLTWASSNIGMSNCNISTVITKGETIFAASSNKIYSSTNLGAKWSELPAGIPINRTVTAIVASGNNILAVAWMLGSPAIPYISSDDGA